MPSPSAGTPSANSPAANLPAPAEPKTPAPAEPKKDVTTPATSSTVIWAAGFGLAAALMSALWFALGPIKAM